MKASDERRHEPTGEASWEESWSFDAVAADGALLCVRLTLRPVEGRAWYWAYFVEPGDGVLVVRDAHVSLPRGLNLEIRSDVLWADTVCETPFEHWSLGLEAFGVRLDHPLDAFAGERGERVAFGLDVEWELSSPPSPLDGGYEQLGTLHGDVLVGARTLAFDAPTRRSHRFGPNDLWATPGVPVASVPLGDGAVCIPIEGVGAARGLVHRTIPGADGWPEVSDIVVSP